MDSSKTSFHNLAMEMLSGKFSASKSTNKETFKLEQLSSDSITDTSPSAATPHFTVIESVPCPLKISPPTTSHLVKDVSSILYEYVSTFKNEDVFVPFINFEVKYVHELSSYVAKEL